MSPTRYICSTPARSSTIPKGVQVPTRELLPGSKVMSPLVIQIASTVFMQSLYAASLAALTAIFCFAELATHIPRCSGCVRKDWILVKSNELEHDVCCLAPTYAR
jgi:hypothetical protein